MLSCVAGSIVLLRPRAGICCREAYQACLPLEEGEVHLAREVRANRRC